MNITVYLGAFEGKDASLKQAVQELGTWIGESGNALVYGGSKSGLMGEIAESVLQSGGTVTGVEPKFFMDAELQYDGLTELIVTKDMTERKTKMIELELPTASWIDAADMMNYPITLNNIQLNMGTSKTGMKYTIDFDGFETVYNAIPAENKGDINGDGVENVSDVTALINKILGLSDYSNTACDINGDGVVNVSDVTDLINMILKSSTK